MALIISASTADAARRVCVSWSAGLLRPVGDLALKVGTMSTVLRNAGDALLQGHQGPRPITRSSDLSTSSTSLTGWPLAHPLIETEAAGRDCISCRRFRMPARRFSRLRGRVNSAIGRIGSFGVAHSCNRYR